MTAKSNTVDAASLATSILRGDADSDLEMVYTAYKNRKEVLANRNLMTLRTGNRVKLHGLRPKVLNGNVGTITALPRNGNSKRFDVELDSDIILRGRVTNIANGIPVQCLELIAD